jgi:hypothetical protein
MAPVHFYTSGKQYSSLHKKMALEETFPLSLLANHPLYVSNDANLIDILGTIPGV